MHVRGQSTQCEAPSNAQVATLERRLHRASFLDLAKGIA